MIKFIRDKDRGYRLENLSDTCLDNLAFLLIDEVGCSRESNSVVNWLNSDYLVFNGNIIFLRKADNRIIISMDEVFKGSDSLTMDVTDFKKILQAWLDACAKNEDKICLEQVAEGILLRSGRKC